MKPGDLVRFKFQGTLCDRGTVICVGHPVALWAGRTTRRALVRWDSTGKPMEHDARELAPYEAREAA